MKIINKTIQIQTKCENDIIDLSDMVEKEIRSTDIKNGSVTVFTKHSTAAITTIELNAGLEKDFPDMLKRIAPDDLSYEHEKKWHDGNGKSHVKASLIGPSLTIPFNDQKLLLGTWQQLIVLECDIKGRPRDIVLQIFGET